jgi:glycine oxidase
VAALAGPAAVVAEEPAVAFPDEAILDPRELVRGLRVSAERLGVRFVTAADVSGLRVEGGVCRGVRTAREEHPAGAVVDAAGAWAGLAAAGRFEVPIRPARGQILELDAGTSRPARMLHRGHFYLAPREHGRLLAGATVEFAGYDRRVTASAVASLLDRASGLVPALADARFVAGWAGLRPAAPDGLPILGETPLPGYFLATGGFRNGVLMAPAVAPLVAGAALGGPDEAAIAPFGLARFLREPIPDERRFTAGNASW